MTTRAEDPTEMNVLDKTGDFTCLFIIFDDYRLEVLSKAVKKNVPGNTGEHSKPPHRSLLCLSFHL